MKKIQVIIGILTIGCISLSGCKKQQELIQKEQEEIVLEEKPKVEKKEQEELLYIYICGAVKNPGVYCLSKGSRVYQLIEKAGGYLPEADEVYLNQAELLEDGMKLTVYTKEEVKSLQGIDSKETLNEDSGNHSGKININIATASELMELNGIGKGRAKAILEFRKAKGPFQNIEDLMKVDGIKEGLFQKIKEKIIV